jgi:hypothetical protein
MMSVLFAGCLLLGLCLLTCVLEAHDRRTGHGPPETGYLR